MGSMAANNGGLNGETEKGAWESGTRSRPTQWNLSKNRVSTPGVANTPRKRTRRKRGQRLNPMPFCHETMKYMVPSCLVIVTLQYQGTLMTLSPVPKWCFLISTCLYWLIVGNMKQMLDIDSKCFRLLTHTAPAFGSLSVMSLLSTLLPHKASLVPLLIWVLAVLAWPIVPPLKADASIPLRPKHLNQLRQLVILIGVRIRRATVQEVNGGLGAYPTSHKSSIRCRSPILLN